MEGSTMTESAHLQDKVVLVTGGSRGIGAGIVKRLASDGASVAFTYANSVQKADEVVAAVEAAGGRALAIRADSADPLAVRRAVADTVRTFGGLDILVSNAGILMHGALEEFALEDFDRMVAVNVRATFVAAQAATARMREGGRIIVIGSVVAERVGFPGASVYAMTKAAVAGLVRGLARDLGPRGITVNTVQPGPTATDMQPKDPSVLDALIGMIPVRRLGRHDEAAGMVSYLAGPEAAFVTGACLTIDGGYLA
jgi:3-oxoacyl-[acyl-carrier protein] reductase